MYGPPSGFRTAAQAVDLSSKDGRREDGPLRALISRLVWQLGSQVSTVRRGMLRGRAGIHSSSEFLIEPKVPLAASE